MSKGVAIVTGASQGIGRAIALRLAGDGFDVALNDLPSSLEKLQLMVEEITKLGRKAFICPADVSVETEVINMIKQVIQEFGGLDVMVANAGICITKPFLETTAEDWDKLFSINGRGVFLCYKHAALRMIEQGRGGRIIGASSVAGKQGAAFLSSYCASKFAVRGLTQVCATELGKYGITVNAYAPGAIDTAMLQGLGDGMGDREALYTYETSRAVVGYIGKPDDVASLVSYIASKEAHFVTGQTVSVNGGRFFD